MSGGEGGGDPAGLGGSAGAAAAGAVSWGLSAH